MYAYKVVTVINEELSSAMATLGIRRKGYVCGRVYKEGALARADPRSLGIFCFDNLVTARRFVGRDNDMRIYRVRTFGFPTKPIAIFHWYMTQYPLNLAPNNAAPPRGTVCYPAIRLLEQVWP